MRTSNPHRPRSKSPTLRLFWKQLVSLNQNQSSYKKRFCKTLMRFNSLSLICCSLIPLWSFVVETRDKPQCWHEKTTAEPPPLSTLQLYSIQHQSQGLLHPLGFYWRLYFRLLKCYWKPQQCSLLLEWPFQHKAFCCLCFGWNVPFTGMTGEKDKDRATLAKRGLICKEGSERIWLAEGEKAANGYICVFVQSKGCRGRF